MAADRSTVRSAVAAAAVGCTAAAAVMASTAWLVATAGAVVVVFTVAFVRQASRHLAIRRAVRSQSSPGRLAGVPVRMAPLYRTAFVAGLARPEIYCSHDLAAELSPEELRAVTLHERAHQLARDPLRLTCLAAVAPVVGRTRRGGGWLERVAADREIAADRYALDHGVRRSAIASALLKVSPTSPTHAAGFAPAVDLRLHALLDAPAGPAGRRRRTWVGVAVGAVVGVAACIAMFHPLHALVAGICC